MQDSRCGEFGTRVPTENVARIYSEVDKYRKPLILHPSLSMKSPPSQVKHNFRRSGRFSNTKKPIFLKPPRECWSLCHQVHFENLVFFIQLNQQTKVTGC
jgi:hypothetical protein